MFRGAPPDEDALYYWVTEEGNSFDKLMNITYRKLTYY